jgi:hypothetical protein
VKSGREKYGQLHAMARLREQGVMGLRRRGAVL